jgi:hypothetical protein
MNLRCCLICLTLIGIVPPAIAGDLVCPEDFSGSGQATAYEATGLGVCSLAVDTGFRVAISSAQYGNSMHCGECLHITGPDGSVTALIADECPDCASGNLDLNAAAWKAITEQLPGSVPISWERVACPVEGNVQFEFQGSNPFFLRIQASNHRYGTAGMAYFDGANWMPMTRTSDNFFQATVPNLSDVAVRLTATSNQSIEADLGAPDQTGPIDSGRQFSACQNSVFTDRFEQILR